MGNRFLFELNGTKMHGFGLQPAIKVKAKSDIRASGKETMIRAVTTYLLDCHPEVLAAYCFGSFLTAGPFRDIDLGVLLREIPPQTLSYEMDMENRLERRIDCPVDVRILNGAPISFCQAVIRGSLLLDIDPAYRADFENRILKQYFDFSPFRRRYLAEVLNAPV